MAKIFISHAAVDKPLAELLASAIAEGDPPLSAFVASRPGDIRADAEWLPAIKAALLECSSFLIVLTPNSIGRPWVAFETGAAWFSNRQAVLARTSDLEVEEIPLPMGARQVYRLDQPDELAVIAHELGTNLKDPPATAATLRGFPRAGLGGIGEQAWEGISFDGNYYAWAGPLLDLDDRSPVECPTGLVEELRSRGFAVRSGRRDRLGQHMGRGRAQVFATDRRAWKRPVEQNGQLLLVGGIANASNS